MKNIFKLLAFFLVFSPVIAQSQLKSILIFSKTSGYRHGSIKEGKLFFQNHASKYGYLPVFSENAEDINEDNLKKFSAVVFLNTTGDILSPSQELDFERYIQAGGGFVGIHAAADCEYNWPWYNSLVGAYFTSHPGGKVSNVQNGKMQVMDNSHVSTKHLPETFERKDEFYDFKSLQSDKLKFLIKVDESSYQMGKMGDFHPMAWYHEFDGGKSFYTNFGHTSETFSEPLMQTHILEGLKWAMANNLDYTKSKTVRAPEENRFVKTNLVKNLDEPTELAVMPNGKVIFSERKGALKVWLPESNTVKVVANLNVYKKFEYGLMGVGIDPKFSENNWLYLFYAPETDEHRDQFLSRFEYDQLKDTLIFSSEKVVLRFPAKRVECCHTGGSIDWDSKGNLFLSTGDDTNPFASDGYAPIDNREGREGWDARHTSANTNDLRGKILRIKPQDDGSYTIPEGNLFPLGTPKTKPEIYVMGCRNPYRISVDKKTDRLYWGDIGPDAGKSDSLRGQDGLVEFNQAKSSGNYGWPMFTGDNFAYRQYDFNTKLSGPAFDPLHPINDSPHNTGLNALPATNKPLIWYPYGESKLYPLLGKGGCNPMAGPVYNFDEYQNGNGKLPKYLDGKFFAYEWMRDWIILVSMDKDGKYTGMEKFMPNTKLYHPMDMAFSKDGVLYMIEYGMTWFAQNEEAFLSKIEYNPGNRAPIVKVASDKAVGASPLKVAFSSKGTVDYDNDPLTYSWNFGPKIPRSNLKNPVVTFSKSGIYEVELTVKDSKGKVTKESMTIKVGNEMPKLDVQISGNKTFFFGDKINYSVNVSDKEDGKLNAGINSDDVVVGIDYLEGYDKTVIEQGHKSNLANVAGRRLIELSDCKSCHSVDKKSIGPAYKEVASKYKRSNSVVNTLSEKIINGGGGVWGEQAMAAHPQVSKSDAKDMVEYILALNDVAKASLPLKSNYKAETHKGKKDGAYLIQASYTDKGNGQIGPLTNSKVYPLRSPIIKAQEFDASDKVTNSNIDTIGDLVMANEGGYLRFDDIDLAGINTLKVNVYSKKDDTLGGIIELRYGSQNGELLGQIEVPENSSQAMEVLIKNQIRKQNDLYLVFKSTNQTSAPLFGISSLEFKNK